MKLNADFSKRVVIRPEEYDWVDSPASGVKRMMLDRIGDEVARATTIVRFAPNSTFDPHTHGGGEEFLVLEGVFSDEHADHPVGSYVRNPIGTAHRPHIGPEGCTILVKLCQFSDSDTEQKAIDTRNAQFRPGSRPGLTVLPLHSHEAGECRACPVGSRNALCRSCPLGRGRDLRDRGHVSGRTWRLSRRHMDPQSAPVAPQSVVRRGLSDLREDRAPVGHGGLAGPARQRRFAFVVGAPVGDFGVIHLPPAAYARIHMLAPERGGTGQSRSWPDSQAAVAVRQPLNRFAAAGNGGLACSGGRNGVAG